MEPVKSKVCGTPVYMALTSNGQEQAFDAKPAIAWLLCRRGNQLRVECKRKAYEPHAATCSQRMKTRRTG